MNPYKRINKRWRFGMTTALALTIMSNSLLAQEQEDPSDEDIFELSPFVIDTESDVGYMATSTLAGTRLRTDLRDVGSAISIFTPEMMEDTGSDDVAEILVYTANTEVAGGNYSGATVGDTFVDFDQTPRSPNSTNRVRGLAGAESSRNYFLTDIWMEGYNTERVVINRGPNSILFGLGAPGGVINTTLKKAEFYNYYAAKLSFGSFGSNRQSIDLNHQVIENKLAIRVAAVNKTDKYETKPAYQDDQRVYLTATAKLSDNTTIRANAEWGEQDSNRPRWSPPMDHFSQWFEEGQLSYYGHTGSMSDGSSRPFWTVGAGGNWSNVSIVYDGPNAQNPGGIGLPWGGDVPAYRGGIGNFEWEGNAKWYNWITTNFSGDYLRQTRADGGFYKDYQITDRSVFDWKTQMLEGPNKSEYSNFSVYNVTVEHLMLDGNAGIELAYDYQEMENGYFNQWNWRHYGIKVDITETLWDGSPNPNFGRPFISQDGWNSYSERERDAMRATAFYKFEARDKIDGWIGRLLGTHTFTGLANKQTLEATSWGGWCQAMGPDYWAAVGNNQGTQWNSRIQTVQYLGGSMAGMSSPAGLNIQGSKVNVGLRDGQMIDVLLQDPTDPTTPRDLSVGSYSVMSARDNNGSHLAQWVAQKTKQEVESYAAVANSKWWDDTLVSVFGWRRDKVKTYAAGSPPTNESTGFQDVNNPSWALGDSPNLNVTEDTWSHSLVLHTPEFLKQYLPQGTDLSFHWSKSGSFQPASQRFNMYGETISAPNGSTEDYGFTLSLMDNKLVARVNWYETASSGVSNESLREVKNQIVRFEAEVMEKVYNHPANETPDADDNWQPGEQVWNIGNDSALNAWVAPDQWFQDLYNYQNTIQPNGNLAITEDVRIGTVVPVTNTQSEGMEIEIMYNPLPNWSIAFNASKQEAVRTGSGLDIARYIDDRSSVWFGTAGGIFLEQNRTDTVAEKAQRIINAYRSVSLLDGSPTPEIREWRMNLITNYNFKEGKLEGVGVGGAIRWQDEIGIGFPLRTDAELGRVFDFSKPFMGDAETNIDLWVSYKTQLWNDIQAKFQLNVRNVFYDAELIPVSTNPDGSVAAWRIPQPRTLEFSAAFEF